MKKEVPFHMKMQVVLATCFVLVFTLLFCGLLATISVNPSAWAGLIFCAFVLVLWIFMLADSVYRVNRWIAMYGGE